MNSKHNQEHFFDQDFEVTYEDDPVFHYEDIPQQREFQTVDLKSQPKPKPSRQNKKKLQVPLQDDATILMDPIQNGTVTPRSRQKSQHWEEESPVKKDRGSHSLRIPTPTEKTSIPRKNHLPPDKREISWLR
mgnify:CR=1 FL=1